MLSEAVIVPPITFIPATVFSGNVRVVVLVLNDGSELLAPTGPLAALVADLPELCPSV